MSISCMIYLQDYLHVPTATGWTSRQIETTYKSIRSSRFRGVTENTQVFPLEYCIMYTIFGYLIMISNIVCPSFWWMLFPSKVCPFSCGIIIMSFICEELQVLPTSYCQNMTWYKNKGHSTYLLVQENMTYLRNKSHPTYSSVHKDIPGEFHFRHFSIPTYNVYYGQKKTSGISTYIGDE